MKLTRVNGQWVKSVGFYLKNGKRSQKRWYLGPVESDAIIKAAQLQTAWKESGNVMRSEYGPVWADGFKLEYAAETADETLARLEKEGKLIVVGNGADDISLASALAWFASEKQRQLTLRNRSSIQQTTVTKLGYNLAACLLPFPQFKMLSQLNSEALRTIHDYWMGTNHANRPNALKTTVSERTAINYLNSFKTFLRAVATNSDFSYDLPKEIGSWKFSMKPSEVFKPEISELAIIYKEASPRMKCFMLIALNAGQLSNDLGRMTHSDITIDNGHSVIRKVRLKTQQKVIYKGSWTLWPETVKAIKENKTVGGELLFVNKDGKPLWEQKVKAKSDAIGDEFHKLIHRLILDGKPIRDGITFSTLRAFGASWIFDKSQSEYYSKLYLCHSVASGATQHYIDAAYAPLQPLLLDLRKALKFI